MILLYVYCLVRTAWLCDDAYITFRTIENFLAGYGLRWNIDERVQAFTHPLWMFLLSGLRACSGEIYYTAIFTSMALSLAAVCILAFGIARSAGQALLAVAICTFSKAFVDFSTSGLENPLSYLLLAGFLWLYLKDQPLAPRRLLYLSLLAGLLVLNRMDLLLLVAPALAHAFWQHRSRQALGRVLLGFVPFLAWEIFSIIYYGFPFPNPAYAKLGTGIPIAELARHGMDYLLDSLQADPLTLLTLAAALLAVLFWRDRRHALCVAGIALYMLYVVRIGGDFMSGRFLAGPLLAAIAVLATVPSGLSYARWLSGALLVACAGLAAPHPPLLTGRLYGLAWSFRPDLAPIMDERAYYYPGTGLLQDRLGMPSPVQRFVDVTHQLRERDIRVAGFATIGMFGYYAGPEVHVIDYCALADPLLARLPMKSNPNWRIGHFTRHVPDGYLEKLQFPANRFSDPNLETFYEKIRLIVSGPLFTAQRWRAILDMNLGRCDYLVDREFYRHPPERVWLAQVSGGPKPRNISQELPRHPDGVFVLPPAGFIVILGSTSHAAHLEAGLDPGQAYEIHYPQPGRLPVRQQILALASESGQVLQRIDVPPEVVAQGYNRFRIVPAGMGRHGLGFVRPIEDRAR